MTKWKKLALGFVATILLGALGSGLWELALRPMGLWLGKTILTGATLGSTVAQDQIYLEAAKGIHEATSLELFWLTILFLAGSSAWFLGVLDGRRSSSKSSVADEEKLLKLDAEAGKAFLRKRLARVKKQAFIAGYAFVGTMFLFASVQYISYLKLVEANGAYTFFAQSMAICRPYMDDQQARIMESRFAAIRGRADYINVITEMRQIAVTNHQTLPDFNPW